MDICYVSLCLWIVFLVKSFKKDLNNVSNCTQICQDIKVYNEKSCTEILNDTQDIDLWAINLWAIKNSWEAAL